jgi:hypothetical protein
LKLLVRRQRAPFVLVQRARIILLARGGAGTREIARCIGCDERTVREWKMEGALPRQPEVGEPRGRAALWTAGASADVGAVRCRLVQLACERPDGVAAPLREV